MQIKPLINKNVAPVFAEYGFYLDISGPVEYIFSNEQNSITIKFDREKYVARKLRIIYQVSGKKSYILQHKYFYPDFFPMNLDTYSNQQELEVYLNDIVQGTVKIVVPFINIMEDNLIMDTIQRNELLSENTEYRINRFARTSKLTVEPTAENLLGLDKIMDSMKTTVEKRKEDFYCHEDHIIDLAAYFGELIAKKAGLSGQWKWREISEGYKRYVVKAMSYDPLTRVLDAWNFGSEVMNYSLKYFPI